MAFSAFAVLQNRHYHPSPMLSPSQGQALYPWQSNPYISRSVDPGNHYSTFWLKKFAWYRSFNVFLIQFTVLPECPSFCSLTILVLSQPLRASQTQRLGKGRCWSKVQTSSYKSEKHPENLLCSMVTIINNKSWTEDEVVGWHQWLNRHEFE